MFKPWVGENYSDGFNNGSHLLLLGESHYGTEGDNRESFTCDVVKIYGIEKRDRYFTRVAKLVLGVPPYKYLTNEIRSSFYNSIAFYNYINVLVGDRPRQRPQSHHWKDSESDYLSVINQCNPDYIIVLSADLGDYLKGFIRDQGLDLNKYIFLKHPSSWGFSYLENRRIIESSDFFKKT